MVTPGGPTLSTSPDRKPTTPPAAGKNAGSAFTFSAPKYLSATNIKIVTPIERVTTSFGSWLNEIAPKCQSCGGVEAIYADGVMRGQ